MQPVLPIVQLRDATSDDAPFIARVVLSGIDMLEIDAAIPDEQRAIYEHLIDICLMGDTLYSYLNTRIAEIEGYRVGALVAYDGARYAALRAKTFGLEYGAEAVRAARTRAALAAASTATTRQTASCTSTT